MTTGVLCGSCHQPAVPGADYCEKCGAALHTPESPSTTQSMAELSGLAAIPLLLLVLVLVLELAVG